MKNISIIILNFLLTACFLSTAQNQPALIVLSAPSVNEPYYASEFDSIIAYDISFVNTVNKTTTDRAIIIADNATIPYLKAGLHDSDIISGNVADIWIRDFSPVQTGRRVKFDYKPRYLSAVDAGYINNSFTAWFNSTGLVNDFNSSIILDGGNFVWNMADKAIITTRIFTDNPGLTHAQLESSLKTQLNIQRIAFLPEETGDITGHSDGMTMFIDTGHVLLNTYDDTIFRSMVIDSLNTAFPGITITEVPYNYDTTTWDGFPSACGIFLNSLVTENYIYMPFYGTEEDTSMLNLMQFNTGKTVVPVDARKVCVMGGSVRCLTWVVYGSDASVLKNLTLQALPETGNSGQLMSVDPNPASASVVVMFKKKLKTKHTIKITDISGRLVKTIESVSGDRITVNTENFQKGIYTLRLLNAKGVVSTGKLIIE